MEMAQQFFTAAGEAVAVRPSPFLLQQAPPQQEREVALVLLGVELAVQDDCQAVDAGHLQYLGNDG